MEEDEANQVRVWKVLPSEEGSGDQNQVDNSRTPFEVDHNEVCLSSRLWHRQKMNLG